MARQLTTTQCSEEPLSKVRAWSVTKTTVAYCAEPRPVTASHCGMLQLRALGRRCAALRGGRGGGGSVPFLDRMRPAARSWDASVQKASTTRAQGGRKTACLSVCLCSNTFVHGIVTCTLDEFLGGGG